MEEQQLKIAWLSGSKHLPLAIRSIASFAHYCRSDCSLHLLDDGSLTEADREQLAEKTPSVRVHTGAELTESRERVFQGRPALREYDAGWPFCKKIVDLPLMLGTNVVQIDSDVLFFRPFRFPDLHRGESAAKSFVYMQDVGDFYVVRRRDRLLSRDPAPLVSRCNTGFIFLRSAEWIDYDYCEALAKRWAAEPKWLEQSMYCALAARDQPAAAVWDPFQVVMLGPSGFPGQQRRQQQTVAVHYAGGVHEHWPEPNAEYAVAAEADVETLSLTAPRPLTVWRDLRNTLVLFQSARGKLWKRWFG